MGFPFLSFFLKVMLCFCTSMFIILPEEFIHYWGHSLLFVVCSSFFVASSKAVCYKWVQSHAPSIFLLGTNMLTLALVLEIPVSKPNSQHVFQVEGFNPVLAKKEEKRRTNSLLLERDTMNYQNLLYELTSRHSASGKKHVRILTLIWVECTEHVNWSNESAAFGQICNNKMCFFLILFSM